MVVSPSLRFPEGRGPAPLASRVGRGLALPPPSLLAPALLVGAAMLVPVAYLLVRSVGASDEAWDLLFRSRTAATLGRTALLVVTVTGFSVLISVPVAWLTTRTDLPLRKVWTLLTALPLVIPTYVGAYLFASALGPKGLLQNILEVPLGVDRLPEIYGLPGATMTLVLLSYPYVLLVVRSSIVNMDPSMEESARSLGKGPIRTLLTVTVPMLRPAIAAGSLLVALYVLSDFGAVSLMRYETFTWSIYQQYQGAFDRSIAAVLSLVLVCFAVAVLVLEQWSRGRIRYHRTGAGAARTASVVRLGGWRWPAVFLCGALVALALALPASVLMFWLVRGIEASETIGSLWAPARNSLYGSGLAALLAVMLALPVATLSVRHPGVISRAVESVSFVGYALPGVVVALALVFFGANYARPVYLTPWLLIFAYVVLFFPIALGSVRSSVAQVSPSLEEASRSLGRSALRTTWSVTLPLVRSGLVAGAALVFLVTMKELPATLILGPLDFDTLATEVWSASSEAFFARAAAPALLLILLSAVPTAVLVLRYGGPRRW